MCLRIIDKTMDFDEFGGGTQKDRLLFQELALKITVASHRCWKDLRRRDQEEELRRRWEEGPQKLYKKLHKPCFPWDDLEKDCSFSEVRRLFDDKEHSLRFFFSEPLFKKTTVDQWVEAKKIAPFYEWRKILRAFEGESEEVLRWSAYPSSQSAGSALVLNEKTIFF